MLAGMARKYGKPTYHRAYRLREVRTTLAFSLGTLAALTVITGQLTGNADGAYRIISGSLTWGVQGMTAGDGPITVGYAHNDYTVTEIKEAIESASSISIGNKVENERSQRLVRRIGQLTAEEPTLNDGRPLKTRLNWAIPIGTNVALFAYNDDAGAPLTTGAVVHTNGSIWVKDY